VIVLVGALLERLYPLYFVLAPFLWIVSLVKRRFSAGDSRP
jgi:hypothetical protein